MRKRSGPSCGRLWPPAERGAGRACRRKFCKSFRQIQLKICCTCPACAEGGALCVPAFSLMKARWGRDGGLGGEGKPAPALAEGVPFPPNRQRIVLTGPRAFSVWNASRSNPYGLSFRGKNTVIPLGLGREALCRRLALCPFQRKRSICAAPPCPAPGPSDWPPAAWPADICRWPPPAHPPRKAGCRTRRPH